MNEFNATKYKNEYNKENYDRINITVPKGMKDKIKAHVDKYDIPSMGAYINMLIIKDMQERAEEETPGEVLDPAEDK